MTTLNKVIGIISYLPDDKEKRERRTRKLCKLIATCNILFHLPIIIIAQNWPDNLIDCDFVTLYKYKEPLTIIGARKELRRIFLESNYDYLIMLDDDCDIRGYDSDEYLKQIDENPDCWIEWPGKALKLFAISKSAFSQVDYDDLCVEKEEGFEDWILLKKLEYFLPKEKHKTFSQLDLYDASVCVRDPDSTWWSDQVDIASISKSFNEAILKYKR